MNCWRCGQKLPDGSTICPYCGENQNRPVPTGEVGRALRAIYDRYGAATVLGSSAYLTAGLGDLVNDSKKIRNQIKMAMDAGMGRMYLEQLAVGRPDQPFYYRVRRLLMEDAGLNEQAVGELTGYFDEMIGWSVPRRNGGQQPIINAGRPDPNRQTAPVASGQPGRRPEQSAWKQQEANRTGGMQHVYSPLPLPTAPVPQRKRFSLPGLLLSLALFFGTMLLAVYVMPYFSFIMVGVLFVAPLLCMKRSSVKLQGRREGSAVVFTWTTLPTAGNRWYLAVNNRWAAAGITSPVRLPVVPNAAVVTLAYQDGAKIQYADSIRI